MTAQDRLRQALSARNRSQRWVERNAGLATGHLSVFLGRGGAKTADTAQRIAAVLEVSPAWLLTGEGAMESAKTLTAAMVPTPLASSLDRAFDSKRHKVSDALAVQRLLASGLTLTQPGEADGIARALLDAAAELRERGAEVSKDALLEAMALRLCALESLRDAG